LVMICPQIFKTINNFRFLRGAFVPLFLPSE
jgi:hypothetical protein